jgi:hypothetical protein
MKEVLEKIAEAFVEQNRLDAEILKIWQIVEAKSTAYSSTHYLASAFVVLKYMRDEFKAITVYIEKYPDDLAAHEALRELRKIMFEVGSNMFPNTKIGLQVPTIEDILDQIEDKER